MLIGFREDETISGRLHRKTCEVVYRVSRKTPQSLGVAHSKGPLLTHRFNLVLLNTLKHHSRARTPVAGGLFIGRTSKGTLQPAMAEP